MLNFYKSCFTQNASRLKSVLHSLAFLFRGAVKRGRRREERRGGKRRFSFCCLFLTINYKFGKKIRKLYGLKIEGTLFFNEVFYSDKFKSKYVITSFFPFFQIRNKNNNR